MYCIRHLGTGMTQTVKLKSQNDLVQTIIELTILQKGYCITYVYYVLTLNSDRRKTI